MGFQFVCQFLRYKLTWTAQTFLLGTVRLYQKYRFTVQMGKLLGFLVHVADTFRTIRFFVRCDHYFWRPCIYNTIFVNAGHKYGKMDIDVSVYIIMVRYARSAVYVFRIYAFSSRCMQLR